MTGDAPSPLAGLRIALGVSGGIAAYKAAVLVRLLRKADAEVVAVMTEAATRFIGPLTLATLSGKPVVTSLWERVSDESLPSDVEHIGLVKWADFAVLAPATMNTLGELARGLADDPVTTFFGAYPPARSLLAPAMNGGMWRNAATQKNVRLLRARGYMVTGPGRGELACGDEDEGRMAEPEQIVNALIGLVKHGPLRGRRVLVTAGPTREWIDAVRYLSNASTGTMGLAIAEAARGLGARVTLVAGPGVAAAHPAIRRVDVESAAAMAAAVYAEAAEAELTVMAAAVSDWRPAAVAAGKLKKESGPPPLALEPTEDILAGLAARGLGGQRVGFALETADLAANARRKLAAKDLALVVANGVGEGAGFGTGDNTVLVVGPGDFERSYPRTDKRVLGRELMDLIAERCFAARAAEA